jgi:hypothetical protein
MRIKEFLKMKNAKQILNQPRIRTVKPDLFKHVSLFEAEQKTGLPLRAAFIGLFCCCDREGCFRWQPRRLKVDILPYDELDFEKVLNALRDCGFVWQYYYEGELYGCIPSWASHQRKNKKEAASTLPCLNANGDIVFESPPRVKEMPTQARIYLGTTLLNLESAPSSPIDRAVPAKSEIELPVHVGSTTFEQDDSHRASSVPSAQWMCAMPTLLENESISCPTPMVQPSLGVDAASGSSGMKPCSSIAQPSVGVGATQESSWMKPSSSAAQPSLSLEKSTRGQEGKGREEEVEEEVEVEGKQRLVARNVRPCADSKSITKIFEYWKTLMQHPQAQLDPKRKKLIANALSLGYSLEGLCEAIRGCSITPHNQGHNDRGQRYDGLHIILRDSDQIDRFIHNAKHPPRVLNEADLRLQSNIHNLQSVLDESQGLDVYGPN